MNLPVSRSHIAWKVVTGLWAVAVAGGWFWITQYQFATTSANEPNEQSQTSRWPASTQLEPSQSRRTLLLFVHPQCPCTKATVREIERVLASGRLSASQLPKLIVVSWLPVDADLSWQETNILQSAAELPAAEIYWDFGGVESRRFGATTSGTVMLFNPDRTLLFAGGVTAGRGHEGDNIGTERLFQLLSGDSLSRDKDSRLPVFGCPLYASDSDCNEHCQIRQDVE